MLGITLIRVLGIALAGSALPGPAVTVTVRPESQVAGSTFTLADIADITGTDKALAAQVAAVQVGTSPLAGLSRGLFASDITVHLRASRLDPKLLNIICPPTVKITRGGAEVSADALVKAATEALVAARTNKDDGATIEPGTVTAKLFVPPGKVTYQAGAPRGQVDLGNATVPVSVVVDGKPVKTVEIGFRIRRMTQAVLAVRPLPPHTVLTEADLTMGKVDNAPGGTAPVTDMALLVGKRTTRQMLQGALFTLGAVENTPVVTIGAAVTVEVKVGGVCLSSAGLARGAGGVGDRVKVFVTETKKELTGTVVDAKTVRVEDTP